MSRKYEELKIKVCDTNEYILCLTLKSLNNATFFVFFKTVSKTCVSDMIHLSLKG